MVAYYGYILTKIDDLVPCAPLKNPVSDPSGFYYRILGNYYIYITNDIYIYTHNNMYIYIYINIYVYII